jgi:protein-tyrosine phosphatase
MVISLRLPRETLLHSASGHPEGVFNRCPFMNPYWIKKEAIRLGIIPRPRGQDWLAEDISFLKRAGVDVVVSALTPTETEEWGLVDESRCCHDNGVKFLSFPIGDRSVPASLSEFDGLIDSVTEYLSEGKAVVIHCWGGVGRSSVIAACVLVRYGLSADDAFRRIEESRGRQVPDTAEQRQWVERYSSR